MEEYGHQCTNVSAEKVVENLSPFPMVSWMICFIAQNLIMEGLSLMYLIVFILSGGLSFMFFQHDTRTVYLTLKAVFRWRHKTPTVKDELYYSNEYKLENLKKVLIKK